MTMPAPAPWAVRIPAELAARLSTSGSDIVTLAKPAALWLVPIAALPFFVVIVLRSLVDAPRWQLGLQLLLRTAALMAVALALTMPSLESPIRGKTVVFVVDTSASVDASQLAKARELLAVALEQRRSEAAADVDRDDRTRIGLVTYGARSTVQRVPDDADPEALVQPSVGDDGLASDHLSLIHISEPTRPY